MGDVRRIAVFGPESTGKTLLAEKLAAHFRAPLVREYARERWDEQGGFLGLEDMLPVAQEQWRREDAAAAAVTVGPSTSPQTTAPAASPPDKCNLLGYTLPSVAEENSGNCNLLGYKTGGEATDRVPLIICDTEALTTMLWSDLLYGTTPEALRRGAEKRCRHYALYLLLDTDVPFAPDPQRCFPEPEDREKCRRIWRGALERRNLPFVEIRGDWAGRERAAIAAVQELLAR